MILLHSRRSVKVTALCPIKVQNVAAQENRALLIIVKVPKYPLTRNFHLAISSLINPETETNPQGVHRTPTYQYETLYLPYTIYKVTCLA